MRLHIHPVYSEENLDPKYQIGSMRLLKHQVATYEALNNPNVDVIFNTAMTGDGKSLAAFLPAAQILAELHEQSKKHENRAFTEALAEQYNRFYGTSEKPVISHAVKKYWALHNNAPQILDQLQSFRG